MDKKDIKFTLVMMIVLVMIVWVIFDVSYNMTKYNEYCEGLGWDRGYYYGLGNGRCERDIPDKSGLGYNIEKSGDITLKQLKEMKK